MLTTKGYEDACERLCRYGYNYDSNVDEYIPTETDRLVADMSRRQPKYLTNPRKKSYYQAQCGFRGLATTGTVVQLQQRLEYRIVQNDVEIERYLSELQQEVDAYLAAQKARDAELWWRDPDRTLNEKAAVDPFRAMQEDLANGGILTTGCEVFQLDDSCDLEHAARDDSNLAFEVVQHGYASFQLVGQAEAVSTKAQTFRQRDQAWRHEGEVQDRKAEQETRAKHQAILEDAMENPDDWDLTGQWVVDCKELAESVYEHPYFQKAKLTMEIWEEEIYYHHPSFKPLGDHFIAEFEFGVVRGLMRLWSHHAPRDTPIKDNPYFHCIWRGRDERSGEIQLEANNYRPGELIFGNHGTTFEGTFRSPRFRELLTIKGRKVSHGRATPDCFQEDWEGFCKESFDLEAEDSRSLRKEIIRQRVAEGLQVDNVWLQYLDDTDDDE